MTKTRSMLLIGAFALASVACAGTYRAPFAPPPGLLYAKFGAPLDVDANATKNRGKRGEASVESLLGLIATGDASIEAAAKNGKIKTIRHVDYEFQNLLGLYSKMTVVVYGD